MPRACPNFACPSSLLSWLCSATNFLGDMSDAALSADYESICACSSVGYPYSLAPVTPCLLSGGEPGGGRLRCSTSLLAIIRLASLLQACSDARSCSTESCPGRCAALSSFCHHVVLLPWCITGNSTASSNPPWSGLEPHAITADTPSWLVRSSPVPVFELHSAIWNRWAHSRGGSCITLLAVSQFVSHTALTQASAKLY